MILAALPTHPVEGALAEQKLVPLHRPTHPQRGKSVLWRHKWPTRQNGVGVGTGSSMKRVDSRGEVGEREYKKVYKNQE